MISILMTSLTVKPWILQDYAANSPFLLSHITIYQRWEEFLNLKGLRGKIHLRFTTTLTDVDASSLKSPLNASHRYTPLSSAVEFRT